MKYLVDFHNEASVDEIENYLSSNNCIVLKEWDNFDKIFLIESEITPPENSIVTRISEEKSVEIKPLETINLNPYIFTHKDPAKESIIINVNDTKDWWKNYSFQQPELSESTLEIKRLGERIDVYIMDSGIESSHEEFSKSRIVNLYSVTPGDFSDNRGHGTAIASVIAGKTCGITNSVLKIVKIFDPNHTTTEHELLDAIDAIITDHEDNSFSVLNCSWTIPKNDWVEHKFRILESEGVFIVAAAGNNGSSIDDVTPASMMEAITVGAYNQNLSPCNFSNYTGGSTISVNENPTNHGELDGWAPGEQIWAAGLNNTYGYTAGTSIAAAITSAIIASNLSDIIDKNFQRLLGYTDVRISTLGILDNKFEFIFGREDLLDFEDPKYQFSKNSIATIFDRSLNPVSNSTDQYQIVYMVGESISKIMLYDPNITKSIEIITPLPPNFQIVVDGKLYGSPTQDQGPTEGELYKSYNFEFKRISIDNFEELITVNIFIIDQNFEPDRLPSDDPIKISLQQQSCSFNGNCIFYTTFISCLVSCNAPRFCCGFKGTASCVCK